MTPMRDSRVAHRLRPTDPPRLTSWKSLHHLRTASDVSCRPAGTAVGFQLRRKLVALSVSRPRAVLTCNARDASSRLGEELEVETPRRLSSCMTRYENPFERPYLTRSLLFLTNRLPRMHTVSPWPISHVASTRNVSFTLAETFAWETGTFRFAFPANAAMRAADECHPLPDQLHPCSPFFRFSS